jgi:hypothetical protein
MIDKQFYQRCFFIITELLHQRKPIAPHCISGTGRCRIIRSYREQMDAVIELFRKNEQVRNVFWALFIAMAGLVLAQVLDPVTAQQVVGIISGMGI